MVVSGVWAGLAAGSAAVAAAAGAAVKVGAAVLAAVPGVAGLESRQGGRGAATGAGSQSCTVESYIFVK